MSDTINRARHVYGMGWIHICVMTIIVIEYFDNVQLEFSQLTIHAYFERESWRPFYLFYIWILHMFDSYQQKCCFIYTQLNLKSFSPSIAIHLEPNKIVCVCMFSAKCAVIYRLFSLISFIPLFLPFLFCALILSRRSNKSSRLLWNSTKNFSLSFYSTYWIFFFFFWNLHNFLIKFNNTHVCM